MSMSQDARDVPFRRLFKEEIPQFRGVPVDDAVFRMLIQKSRYLLLVLPESQWV